MSDTTGILILESLTSREMSLFYSLFFTDSSYYRKECMICKLSYIRKISLLYFKDNNEFMSIDQKVLNPALAELREHLNNLTVDKVKEGRSIVSLQFRWNANTINPISF